jgi:hypothetical protein
MADVTAAAAPVSEGTWSFEREAQVWSSSGAQPGDRAFESPPTKKAADSPEAAIFSLQHRSRVRPPQFLGYSTARHHPFGLSS